MLEHFRGQEIDKIQQHFRWTVPDHYNIGVDCADRHPPQRVALVHIDEHDRTHIYRYGELSRLSNKLANAMAGLGVEAGDRVAVILPQGPHLVISHLAIYKLGAVAVPLTTLFGPEAIKVRLGDSGARLAITDQATATKIEVSQDGTPALDRIIQIEADWESLLSQSSDAFTARDTRSEDPALLIYTSGTTGGPKGVLHGHRVLLGHLPGFELSHHFYGQPGDRFWTPADWAWIGGLYDALFPVLHHGSSIISSAGRGPFDPERALSMLARHGARNAFLPPTALKMMRRSDARPPSELRLRTVMSGGEVLGEEILAWTQERLGVTVNEIYGQTECNYVIGNAHLLYPVRPGSMGRTFVGHEVAVLDGDGQTTRDLGEIAIHRSDRAMFLQYWQSPEATREKFDGDWLRTGDMATSDGDGYFWFNGRIDDLIISAGYRIGPGEIEDCLLRHPAVAMAAAIGVPDPIRGHVVKAYIVLRPGRPPSHGLEEEIQEFVRRRLAAYEYPREIEFLDEMPMTTTGKIRRRSLRERHQASRVPASGIGGSPDDHREV